MFWRDVCRLVKKNGEIVWKFENEEEQPLLVDEDQMKELE